MIAPHMIERLFRCVVGLADGVVITCDGLAYAGKLWLVTGWLATESEDYAIPERLIRFDSWPHQAVSEGPWAYQNIQLPIAEPALRGRLPTAIEYVDRPLTLRVDKTQLLMRLYPPLS